MFTFPLLIFQKFSCIKVYYYYNCLLTYQLKSIKQHMVSLPQTQEEIPKTNGIVLIITRQA